MSLLYNWFLFVESRAVTVVQLQWLLVGHSDSGATVQHPLLSASYPGRLLESDLAHLSCPGIISPRYPPRWQSSPADVFIPVRIFGLFVLTLSRQEILPTCTPRVQTSEPEDFLRICAQERRTWDQRQRATGRSVRRRTPNKLFELWV